VAAVEPRALVLRHLATRPPFEERRLFVVGGGKAAVAMAAAAEEALGDRIAGGVVVTKRGHALEPLRRFEVIEVRHSVPDEECARGARRILEAVESAGEGDRILFLLSGGASALLSLPREGIAMEDYALFCGHLMRSGAPIEDMNAIRRHLTLFAGGGLAAAAHPRPLTALILSDVLGNPLPAIGSGPTAPDPSTFKDALDAVQRWGLFPFASQGIVGVLGKGMVGREPETRKPGDPVFDGVENAIVGDNALALEGARAKAEALGYRTSLLTGNLRGDAALAGRAIALAAREARASDGSRACLLAGGETTVSVENAAGLGGRAQELALAAALALEGSEGIVLFAAGTDGNDGPTDVAGALVDGGTARGARSVGEDPVQELARHNSYGFFEQVGGHVRTGPTGTNVMDLVVALVE
jgi:glycerate 2-kinase